MGHLPRLRSGKIGKWYDQVAKSNHSAALVGFNLVGKTVSSRTARIPRDVDTVLDDPAADDDKSGAGLIKFLPWHQRRHVANGMIGGVVFCRIF